MKLGQHRIVAKGAKVRFRFIWQAGRRHVLGFLVSATGVGFGFGIIIIIIISVPTRTALLCSHRYQISIVGVFPSFFRLRCLL